MKVILFIAIFHTSIFSQTFVMQEIKKDNLSFDFNYKHPFLSSNLDISAFSGVYELSAGIPISERYNLKLILPVTAISFDDFSETSVGNIFLGFQTRVNNSPEKIETFSAGIFLPTSSNKKVRPLYLGIITSHYELHKYLPDFLVLYFNYSFFKIFDNGLSFNFEGGPKVYFYTGEANADNEIDVYYGLSGGYHSPNLFLRVELIGSYFISEGGAFFDKLVNSLVMGLGWEFNNIRPRIFYIHPFNESLREATDGTIGIKIEAVLP